MTTPTTDDDEAPTVRAPTRFDVFGKPVEFVDADPEVAGQWDPRCWRDYP